MKKILSIFLINILLIFTFSDSLVTEKIDFLKDENKFEWVIRPLLDNGNTVNDLSKENFEVFYKTKADHTIIKDIEPVAVSVIMDASASVAEKKDEIKKMFFDVLKILPPNSQRVYIHFNNRVHIFKRLENSEPEDWTKITEMDFEGPSAFYDSVYYSARMLSSSPLKKLVVVISDAIDEVHVESAKRMSEFSLDLTIEMINKSGVKLVCIPPKTKRRDNFALQRLQEEAGAEIFDTVKEFESFSKKYFRKRFNIVFNDPLINTQSDTREIYISINYKSDTLNLKETINRRENKRYLSRDIMAYYKSYKIAVEDVIVDYPKITFIAYTYDHERSVEGPDSDDVRVISAANIKPVDVNFEYDPNNVSVLFDKSGSMKDFLDENKDFLARFYAGKQKYHKFSLMVFDNKFKYLNNFDKEVDMYGFRNKVKAGGATRLYDTMMYAAMELEEINTHKSMIVFTDGKDTRYEEDVARLSKYSFKDINGVLKYRSIPAYVICFNPEGNVNRMAQLCVYSGGAFFLKPTEKSISELYELIDRNMTGYYTLKFENPRLFPSQEVDMLEALYIKEDILMDIEHKGYRAPDTFF